MAQFHTPWPSLLESHESAELPGISVAPISKHFIIEPLTRAPALEVILGILATLGATEGFLGRDRYLENRRLRGSSCTVHVTSLEACLAHLSRKSLVSQRAHHLMSLPASPSWGLRSTSRKRRLRRPEASCVSWAADQPGPCPYRGLSESRDRRP